MYPSPKWCYFDEEQGLFFPLEECAQGELESCIKGKLKQVELKESKFKCFEREGFFCFEKNSNKKFAVQRFNQDPVWCFENDQRNWQMHLPEASDKLEGEFLERRDPLYLPRRNSSLFSPLCHADERDRISVIFSSHIYSQLKAFLLLPVLSF